MNCEKKSKELHGFNFVDGKQSYDFILTLFSLIFDNSFLSEWQRVRNSKREKACGKTVNR